MPPWQKGRYGSAIGRAVHAVLQTVDLATGQGLAEAGAAQAAAEGVLGREGVIEAFCRGAQAGGPPHGPDICRQCSSSNGSPKQVNTSSS